MNQVRKFYISSFLKNQTYFVPIMILFFQDIGLSYSDIFWIFTIGSIFSFIVEIPTGIFADMFGKRRSLIISRLLIFISFIAFALSETYWMLLLSNLLFVFGQSFRTGTEVSYIYDYLKFKPGLPSYTTIKNKQKIYARISEAAAALIGGFIAYKFGFSYVFVFASIPAAINLIETISWVDFEKEARKEKKESRSIKSAISMIKESLHEVKKNPGLFRLLINIMIFSSVFFALDKFIQPYMKDIGINLEYFGLIYSGMLILTALVVKLSDYLEEKYGDVNVSNYLTLVAFIPVFIIGLGFKSYFGIALLFLILMIENIRSSTVNTIFHDMIDSKNRSTMGSILELFRSTGKLIILPVVGYLADAFSIYTAILLLAGLLLINGTFFWIKEPKKKELT